MRFVLMTDDFAGLSPLAAAFLASTSNWDWVIGTQSYGRSDRSLALRMRRSGLTGDPAVLGPELIEWRSRIMASIGSRERKAQSPKV